eukprot:jgi/Undpi1/7994/HiC_scaffold_24.g10466.m1
MGLVSGKTASQDSGLTPKFTVLGGGTGYEIRSYDPYVVAEVQAGPEAGAEDDRFRTLAKAREGEGARAPPDFIPPSPAKAHKNHELDVHEKILAGDTPKAFRRDFVVGKKRRVVASLMVLSLLYIGVFGSPENKAKGGDEPEAISMTAPVVVGSPSPDPGTKISMTAPVIVNPAAESTMQFIMPTAFKSISDLPTPTDKRVTLREVPGRLYLVRQFSGNMGSASAHDAAIERQRMITEEGTRTDGGSFTEYVTIGAKLVVARYNPPWTLPFLKTNELWFPLPLSTDEAIAKLPTAVPASK